MDIRELFKKRQIPDPSPEESVSKKSRKEDNDEDSSQSDADAGPSQILEESRQDPIAQVTTTESRTTPGPKDLSQLPDDGPYRKPKSQGKLVCRQNKFGRRFSPQWLDDYKWLEYSEVESAAYCFLCRHFSSKTEGVFIATGFDSWTKCYGQDPKINRLIGHQASYDHSVSDAKYKAFRDTQKSGKTVIDALDEAHREEVEKNRIYLKLIVDTLRLTAIQNIAQRGHRNRTMTIHKTEGTF